MRTFSYITVGKILETLRHPTDPNEKPLQISRSTFYNLEEAGFFESVRTSGRWRRYSEVDANAIIRIIRENFGLDNE